MRSADGTAADRTAADTWEGRDVWGGSDVSGTPPIDLPSSEIGSVISGVEIEAEVEAVDVSVTSSEADDDDQVATLSK